MDLSTALAASPWLKKAWRWTPAPLRMPLLLIAGFVLVRRWLRKRRDDELTPEEHANDPEATSSRKAAAA